MSDFAVPVVALDNVLSHPNADRLELAQVGGYVSVVPKGIYNPGTMVIYVPEGAIVPEWILEEQGLVGKLSGSQKNRVKAIKLRGVLSQGLVMPVALQGLNTQIDDTVPHDDISGLLGITKYEPPVPTHMAGQVGALFGYTVNYDFENIKARPNLLRDDEYVILTEKLHGTCCQIGWCADLEPREDLFDDGRMFVTSKGIGKRGMFLKNSPENADNLYVRVMRRSGLEGRLREFALNLGLSAIWLFGEIFGDVQDLKYGHKPGEVSFRLFDIRMQFAGNDPKWVHAHDLLGDADALNLDRVPVVAQGPWSWVRPRLNEFTRGKSLLADQIREGVVIRPAFEREDPRYGRVILKSVSEDYLLRGGDTTELQ